MLRRLTGLETEYAPRYHPVDERRRCSRFVLFQRLATALRATVLTVRAQHFKEGVFTANGGAVWFESERPASGAGLIEGATPECRGARQVVAYQRAQDRLLAAAASNAEVAGTLQLIKNDRDAAGNVYGAQENYQAEIARGAGLLAWRAGLILLLPLVLLSWLAFYLLIGLLLIYLGLAGGIYLLFQGISRDRQRFALLLFGRDLVEGRETGAPTPAWMESLVLQATRVLSAPLALALWLHCQWFAFRTIRRRLTPFLVSRAVIGGAGLVDQDGQFRLADKAPAINCLMGFGGFFRDRPIYTMGHFFKALCVECMFSLRNYFSLFATQQRLQIGLGDSNMSESAEYLRIGTTLLVLDAIEAGELPRSPALRHSIQALHALAADPTLKAEVSLRDGRAVTALELQRDYLEVCRRFVERHDSAPPEAYDILRRWEDTLEALVEHKLQLEAGEPPGAPPRLFGVLDWITKKHLLDHLGPNASWGQRKKLDICYHELSAQGYFQQLQAAGCAARIVTDAEIERATRLPPPDSPATRRGHFIREFGDSGEQFAVNWRFVTIGRGRRAKIVRLQSPSAHEPHAPHGVPNVVSSPSQRRGPRRPEA